MSSTATRNHPTTKVALIVLALTGGACGGETTEEAELVESSLPSGGCEDYRHHLNDIGGGMWVEAYYSSCGDKWKIHTISVQTFYASRGAHYQPIIRRYSGANYAKPVVITWQGTPTYVPGDGESYTWNPNWVVSKSLNPYVYAWNTDPEHRVHNQEISPVLRLR